jgi:uncharacterized glyoxalase superfamily protein PhnB
MSDQKPEIACEDVFPTIIVGDVVETVDFYHDKLAFDVDFIWGEPPEHAGVSLGTVSVHFSKGNPSPDGFWIYLIVDDVDALYDRYQSNGVEVEGKPESYPWGMREFSMKDLNGCRLRFGQHDHRSGDPIQIDRVDLQVRIEERLAGLTKDLAAHKGMSVGELFEETLLHTFEPVTSAEGRWVASPHVKQTFPVIEELKKKHGIDYDTHASYRFSEQ